MSTQTRFEVAGGSVAGRAHVAGGTNNQDAFAWAARGDALVAVVTDGCGSAKHSEVGARLGARLVVEAALGRIERGAEPPSAALWDAVRRDVCARLSSLAIAMGGSLTAVVADHFLFTLVGFAASPAGACTFALGDGIAMVDGDARRFGPFAGNEPPYLAYNLLGRDLPIEVHHRLFAEEVSHVVVGTDGVLELEAAVPLADFSDDRYFRNFDAVRRRLAIASRTPGLLPDDTTLLTVRRRS